MHLLRDDRKDFQLDAIEPARSILSGANTRDTVCADSSKQAHAPEAARPLKNLPIALWSNPSEPAAFRDDDFTN